MTERPYVPDVSGMRLTGTIPVRVDVSAVASGKRRNDATTQMVEPQVCKQWELASDEAAFHGGDETAPKPLSIFATGILACFMTQMRTFARPCGVDVRGLRGSASMAWTLTRNGTKPYAAAPGCMTIDIELESDAPLEAKMLLIRTAARGCPAEASLLEQPLHRLKHEGQWFDCEAS